jgi:hypothetical protein
MDNSHIQQTIEHYQAKLGEQEKTVIKTKLLINQLSSDAGLPPPYPDAESESETSASLSIESDKFYGQPLAKSIRKILEMRKALSQGPATVNEIYNALINGGYAFDTLNVENAKRGLRISLTKNTATFHKLPNGRFGLLEWYPRVKPIKAADHEHEDEEKEDTASTNNTSTGEND